MKPNFKYFFIGLFFLSIRLFSQNENTKWYFGNYAGLDFMTNPPTILANSSMSTAEGCASIADAAGNLLFYTDGMTVWNQAHSVMANGTGLFGNGTSSQSCLIVKKPGSSTLYYIFTVQGFGGTIGFNYSIVDMSLSSGQGSLTVLNSPLYTSSCNERITGTMHCNGIDVWMVIHENNNSNFRSYLLTSAGVNTTAVVSTIGSVQGYLGCMKISPTQKKLAIAGGNLELFDFNNSTGVLTNSVALVTYSLGGYGCEFSPDGTKLYSQEYSLYLYQFDLCASTNAAIVASKYILNSGSGYGSMQLAPNGKIYVAMSVSPNNFLGVINNPNMYGSAANYSIYGQSISPKSSDYGLPNFISRFIPSPFTHTVGTSVGCQTAAFTVSNCPLSGMSLSGVAWNFGDLGSGANNISFATNPVHIFSGTGNYTVQLVYYYSCGGTDTLKDVIFINQPCFSISSNSITCASLGSATITTLPNTAIFSYTWMPSMQTGSIATGLNPGTHTINVFNANNNTTFSTITVFAPLIPLTGNISNSSSITCNGANTGTASVTNLAGGSGNQSYVWFNGLNIYTTNPVNTLSAGIWSITVTDSLTGCQIYQSFYISQPPPLNLMLSSNTATNCAGTNIVLTGTNSGGMPSYTYSWTAGPTVDTQTVSETIGGAYVYTLNSSDVNNCLTSNTIAVGFISNPVLTVPHVSICPLQTGTLAAFGATTYTWTSPTLSLTGNTFTDSPLSNTQYSVVGSALGCTSIATASIVVKYIPLPMVIGASTFCNGDHLTFNAYGGAFYQWSGPNSFTSALQNININPVSVNNTGVYTMTVTAVNGCTASTTKTIIVNPTPTLSTLGSTVCTSQTLNLSASFVNGATYLWSGPQGFTSNLQNPFIVNPPTTQSGTYTVKVTDALTCTNTAIAIASVVPPPSLTVSLSGNGTLCAQALNGSPNTITLTSSGAATYTLSTPNYIANPHPGGPISPLYTLPPYNNGIATATLMGSNGICAVFTTTNFSVIPNPTVSISSPTPIICAGQSYTYTNQGASSYTWGPGSPNLSTYTGPATVASPSLTSVYSVVGGSLGCNSGTQTSTITVNPLPTITIVPGTPTVCLNERINLTANGNATSFTWSPYVGLNTVNGVSVSANPVSLQSYTLVGSLNNCTNTAIVTVSVLSLPSPTATILKPRLCLNELITLQGFGGIVYEWSNAASLLYAGQTVTFVASSLGLSGTYTLTVSDENNCRNSSTAELTIYDLPRGTLLASKQQNCVPFNSDFTFYSALSSASLITTSWELNREVFKTKNFSYDFKIPDNYIIMGDLRDTLTNCTNTQTFVVRAYPNPVAGFTYLPEKPIENLEEVIFTNTSSGEELKKWNWYFINNKGYQSENKNTAYLFTEAGIYPVAMVVSNKWDCKDTLVKAIKVEADLTMYVPNIFTPNEDGKNDVFIPVTRAVRSFELSVYNRWGAKVFSSSDTQTGWDGTYAGEPCKNDVYVWKIVLSSVNGEAKTMTGHVTLSR